jgi:hypothetical protein
VPIDALFVIVSKKAKVEKQCGEVERKEWGAVVAKL